MNFPAWVDGPRKTKAQRASARLKYILNQLAFEMTGKKGMREFAPKIGLDQSTLYLYIRQGAFTVSCATTVEKALGRAVIRREWLTNPLEIKTTTA